MAHPLVADWALRPDAVSPRWLELSLDAAQYPDGVEPSPIETANHLGVLFAVLEWVTERVETLHAT